MLPSRSVEHEILEPSLSHNSIHIISYHMVSEHTMYICICGTTFHVALVWIPVQHLTSQIHLFRKPPISPHINLFPTSTSKRYHFHPFRYQCSLLARDSQSFITSWRNNAFRRNDPLSRQPTPSAVPAKLDRLTCHGMSVVDGSIFIALPTCLQSATSVAGIYLEYFGYPANLAI